MIEKKQVGSPEKGLYLPAKTGKLWLNVMSVPRCAGCCWIAIQDIAVTSREGRVSRNADAWGQLQVKFGHVPRGTCE